MLRNDWKTYFCITDILYNIKAEVSKQDTFQVESLNDSDDEDDEEFKNDSGGLKAENKSIIEMDITESYNIFPIIYKVRKQAKFCRTGAPTKNDILRNDVRTGYAKNCT